VLTGISAASYSSTNACASPKNHKQANSGQNNAAKNSSKFEKLAIA
jgi:hypothetical protein